jgi:Rieske Fe-S protein
MAAASLLLAGCGSDDDDGDGGVTQPPPGTVFTATVANFPALAAVGGAARVQANPPIALARTAAAEYRAYSLVCTHAGTTVEINANNTLRCPNHGAEFAFDGRWTGGAQRTSSLTSLTTTFDPATGIARITI